MKFGVSAVIPLLSITGNIAHQRALDFAACAMNHTFTATILCRKEQKLMNTCMIQYATQAEQDAAREEWFANIDKRREEREKKEMKRKEDEKFWREWWDKDLRKKPGHSEGQKT